MSQLKRGDSVIAKLVVAHVSTDGTAYLQPEDDTEHRDSPVRYGPPTLTLSASNIERLMAAGVIIANDQE